MLLFRHAAALVLAASSASLSAATIVPVAAAASSQYPGYEQGFAIDTGVNARNTDWAAQGTGAGSYIDFDLGAIYRIGAVHIVDRVTSGGANGGFVGGTADYTTQFSLQQLDGLGGNAIGGEMFFGAVIPTGTTSYASFTHDIDATFYGAQFIRYRVVATSGANPGLSDFSFGTAGVPEPAQWALLIGGFGMVGRVARRRRTLRTA